MRSFQADKSAALELTRMDIKSNNLAPNMLLHVIRLKSTSPVLYQTQIGKNAFTVRDVLSRETSGIIASLKWQTRGCVLLNG